MQFAALKAAPAPQVTQPQIAAPIPEKHEAKVPRITPALKEAIYGLNDQGLGASAIAKKLGLKQHSVSFHIYQRRLKQQSIPAPSLRKPLIPQEKVDQLWALHNEGKTATEIARLLGLNVAAVASRIRRAQEKAKAQGGHAA